MAKKWFYSYVWRDSFGHSVFESAFSETHPLIIVKNWKVKFQGNNDSKLLYYTEVTDLDFDTKAYVEDCLKNNHGEFYKGRENVYI